MAHRRRSGQLKIMPPMQRFRAKGVRITNRGLLLSDLSSASSPAPINDLSEVGAFRQRTVNDPVFRALTDAFPHMVWSTLPDGFHDFYNRSWYEFTGVPDGSTDGEAWNGMFHPDDQERAWSRWRQSLETGTPYEIEYRLRHKSGAYRWTLGRAFPIHDEQGRIVRWIGTCTDIDEQKRHAEQNEILSRELSHRIKNIFAVIVGLIGLSARRQPQATAFANELRDRVAALGRAHEFVRPHSEQSAPQVGESTLSAILTDLLSPYPALAEGRLTIVGEAIRVDDQGATPIALVVHELATNSSKYGALSVPEGLVDVKIGRSSDTVELSWIETNGPRIESAPTRTGFGSQLAELSVVRQLGGTLNYDWRPTGLRVKIAVNEQRLRRPETSFFQR
jgi:PAS domain S-box-containing protein